MNKRQQAKDFMLSYKNADEKVRLLEMQIKESKEMIADLGSINFSKVRVISSMDYDALFVKKIELMNKLECTLKNEKAKKQKALKKIKEVISSLSDDRSKDILTKLYVKLLEWNDIFNHGELAESTYYLWHKKALDEVAEILEEQSMQ